MLILNIVWHVCNTHIVVPVASIPYFLPVWIKSLYVYSAYWCFFIFAIYEAWNLLFARATYVCWTCTSFNFLSRDFLFISCMFIYLYIYYYQKSMIPLNSASLFFFSTTDLVHTSTTTSGAVEGVEEVRYVDIIQILFLIKLSSKGSYC